MNENENVKSTAQGIETERFCPRSVMVTGGAGFIGSNYIRYIFNQKEFVSNVINVDRLTYAGNLENLAEIDKKYGSNGEKRYSFYEADITDFHAMEEIITRHNVDMIVHFAAESHVDRSIHGPGEFIKTNIMGTFTLLEVIRKHWKQEDFDKVLFHHISTDEVYGSLGDTGFFFEETKYDPRSPYSASKASSDHIVRAYYHTYGIPVTISNCSNNYGPYQFPEKLIPLMILNGMEGKNLPVYGDGLNVRDWLYVEDHCSAIYTITRRGKAGETYNIGGENEQTNIDVVKKICADLSEILPVKENDFLNCAAKKIASYSDLIVYVKDRPGHDRRYAINCDKIKNELGWTQSVTFDEGLKKTVRWYVENREWVEHVRSGEYKNWIDKNYTKR